METENSYHRMVLKHHEDLYEGDGPKNPSMTNRLTLLEVFKQDMGEKVDKLNKSLDRAIWLLIATLAGVIVDIMVKGK